MAEAAALAVASVVCSVLQFAGVNYLSDCEQLVRFLHQEDLSNPPEWRIKYFTQVFANNTHNSNSCVYKISRQINTVADYLAKQASLQSADDTDHSFICTTEHHGSNCNILQALQGVGLTGVTIIAASCC